MLFWLACQRNYIARGTGMISLPVCKFRGQQLSTGRWYCANWSCYIYINPQGVSEETCFQCARVGYADKDCGPVEPIKPQYGVGNLLHSAISSIGLSPSSDCQCNARIAQMNTWGWQGCWDNRNMIAVWLAEESAKRGIQVEPTPQALFIKGMELLKQRGAGIPGHVLDALGKVIDDDPELAKAVQEEIDKWQIDLNELFQPKVEWECEPP